MSVNFGSQFQPSFGSNPTTVLSGPGNTVQYTGLPGGFQLSSVQTPVPQQSQFQTGFAGGVAPQQSQFQTGFAGGVAPQQPQFQTGFGGGFFQQPAVQQLAYQQQGFQQPAPQFQHGPLYQQPYQPQPANSGLQDVLGMVMNLFTSMFSLMMNQMNGQQGQNNDQSQYGQNNYGQNYGNTGYDPQPAGNGYDTGYQNAGYNNNAYPAEEVTQDTTVIVEKEMDKQHKHGHHDNGLHRGHHKHHEPMAHLRMQFDA